MNIVALIPARAGSKRIPGKNTRLLAGHPLIAYTIAAAQQSGVFRLIVVCSDDEIALSIGLAAGAWTWQRPPSGDDEPDIAWVRSYFDPTPAFDAFAILRPTSPFRSAATIQRAWREFSDQITNFGCDSMRAVEPWTGHHPAKMWDYDPDMHQIYPILSGGDGRAPWHSSPSQTLPKFYRQNASLEMAWTHVLEGKQPTISGGTIRPFFTEGYEGFDINDERDWAEAERLIASGEASLPPVPVARVQAAPTPQ